VVDDATEGSKCLLDFSGGFDGGFPRGGNRKCGKNNAVAKPVSVFVFVFISSALSPNVPSASGKCLGEIVAASRCLPKCVGEIRRSHGPHPLGICQSHGILPSVGDGNGASTFTKLQIGQRVFNAGLPNITHCPAPPRGALFGADVLPHCDGAMRGPERRVKGQRVCAR
jgi:hypothetical protein